MDTIYELAVSPFNAGTPSARNGNNQNQDGKTATTVLMLFVLSIIFVLHWAFIFKGAYINTDVVLVTYGVFVLCGLLTCVVTSFVSCVDRMHLIEIGVSRGSNKVEKVFLWLFGIPSMAYTALKAGNLISCDYINGTSRENTKPKIFYHASTTLFTMVEMVFISYFSAYKLKNSLLANYTFFFLVIGNLSIWFHSLMLHEEQAENTPLIPENSTEFEECIANSTITIIIKKITPFVSPIFLEYFLLTITLARKFLSPDECLIFPVENAGYLAVSREESTTSENSMDSESSTLSNNNAPSNPLQNRARMVFYLIIVMFLIDGTLSFLGYFIKFSNTSNSQVIYFLLKITGILKKLLMSGLIMAGFVRLELDTYLSHLYHAFVFGEYVFLFTGFGEFCIHSVGFFGSVSEVNALSLVHSVMNMLEDYLQVTFIIHANRCKPKSNRPSTKYLHWICFILLIINFESWLTDSFFLFQYPELRNKSVYSHTFLNYGGLRFLLPISVYYRFVSCFAFYELSKKFDYPQQK